MLSLAQYGFTFTFTACALQDEYIHSRVMFGIPVWDNQWLDGITASILNATMLTRLYNCCQHDMCQTSSATSKHQVSSPVEQLGMDAMTPLTPSPMAPKFAEPRCKGKSSPPARTPEIVEVPDSPEEKEVKEPVRTGVWADVPLKGTVEDQLKTGTASPEATSSSSTMTEAARRAQEVWQTTGWQVWPPKTALPWTGTSDLPKPPAVPSDFLAIALSTRPEARLQEAELPPPKATRTVTLTKREDVEAKIGMPPFPPLPYVARQATSTTDPGNKKIHTKAERLEARRIRLEAAEDEFTAAYTSRAGELATAQMEVEERGRDLQAVADDHVKRERQLQLQEKRFEWELAKVTKTHHQLRKDQEMFEQDKKARRNKKERLEKQRELEDDIEAVEEEIDEMTEASERREKWLKQKREDSATSHRTSLESSGGSRHFSKPSEASSSKEPPTTVRTRGAVSDPGGSETQSLSFPTRAAPPAPTKAEEPTVEKKKNLKPDLGEAPWKR